MKEQNWPWKAAKPERAQVYQLIICLLRIFTASPIIFCYDARPLAFCMSVMLDKILNNISIVMVETSHPGNIGAAARAMKTMGLSNLILVKPLDFPAQKAIWRSAGASDVVESAQVVDNLEEAIADCALVLAASARQRRIPWPMLDPHAGAQKAAAFAQNQKVAIVFGREDRGLKNEELQLCNYHVEIPANQEYPVLNVAAAVQVICYELRKQSTVLLEGEQEQQVGGERPCSLDNWDETFATQADLERFYEHLEQVLIAVDFHDPDNPRQLMTRLQRLFNRSHLDRMEMNILRGILTAVQKATANKN